MQSPLSENTQQSQGTEIHAPGIIRTHSLCQGASADPRLRQRVHWNRFKWPKSIDYGLKDREIGVK